jgi:hypothetical protein
MANQSWPSRPILAFAGLAVILVVACKRAGPDHYRSLVYGALMSAFCYGASVITTLSSEFRYYFPSFYLNVVVVLAANLLGFKAVLMIAQRNATGSS